MDKSAFVAELPRSKRRKTHLVTEPIGSLDRIICVPAPYIINSVSTVLSTVPNTHSQSSSVMFPKAALIPPCEFRVVSSASLPHEMMSRCHT